MVLGIVGSIVGGLIFGGIALLTGFLYGIIALISGAVTGIMVGYGTKGLDEGSRTVIGAIFGFLSILFGYYLIYYMLELPIGGHIIKPSELMSFVEFMKIEVGPLDLLFFAVGIIESASISKKL